MSNDPEIKEFDHMFNLEGRLIAFEFTMSDEKEVEIDSNVGKNPMIFQSGIDEMMPAVEEALLKMEIGEAKRITLTPEQAYGEVMQKAFRKIPINNIPEAAREVGRKVMSRAPDGEETMVDVVAVTDEFVTLDFNHPLAGMTLFFDLKLISNDALR